MSEAFSRVKEIIQAGVDEKVFSGAALGISLYGETIVEEYFGKTSFEDDAKIIDKDTRFDLASISKIFSTTSIALRFIDRGLLRVYDKVGDFFPEATAAKDITVLQLMTHTSGQPGHYKMWEEAKRNSSEQIREVLLHRKLKNIPGTVEEYSCMGYLILGEILKKISGKTLDVLFAEEVAGPLGIENTSYGPIDPDKIKVAQTTDFTTGEALNGVVHDENARFQGGVSANAGLFSTLHDLMRYGQTLYNSGFVYNEDDNFEQPVDSFISYATLDKAKLNYTEGLAQDRGLGFILASSKNTSFGELLSDDAFGHTGFTGTSLIVDPMNGLVITILTNRVIQNNDGKAAFRLRALAHNSIVADAAKYCSNFFPEPLID